MSLPTEAALRKLYWTVVAGLGDDPEPDTINALNELTFHARLGLEPRRQKTSKKKTGKPSQEPEVIKLAADLLREFIAEGKASAKPNGVELPRGFAAELSRRCDLAGIDLTPRRVETIAKAKQFKFKLYMLVR